MAKLQFVGVVGGKYDDRAKENAELLERPAPHLFKQAIELVLRGNSEYREEPNSRIGTDVEEADYRYDPKDERTNDSLRHDKKGPNRSEGQARFDINLISRATESSLSVVVRPDRFFEVSFSEVGPASSGKVEFRIGALHE